MKRSILARPEDPAYEGIEHRYPVIVHSDQGSTYASQAYQAQLKENRLIGGMNRKGECLDNDAVAESFFSTLKKEAIYQADYKTQVKLR